LRTAFGRRAATLAAVSGAAVLAFAAPANALPTRTVCAAGALVNNTLATSSIYWTNTASQCMIQATGSAAWSTTTAAYGSVSVPVEDMNSGTTQMNYFFGLYGGDGANSSRPQICAAQYSIDQNGNISAGSAIKCTSGTTASHQNVNLSGWLMSVPAYGALIVNFAAQKGAGVDIVGINGLFPGYF
jgi:hypothetical protein